MERSGGRLMREPRSVGLYDEPAVDWKDVTLYPPQRQGRDRAGFVDL